MSDLIDRQAMIDALARVAREKFNLSDEVNHYLAGFIAGANLKRISESRSAEEQEEANHG